MAESPKSYTYNLVSAKLEERNCLVCRRPLTEPVKMRDCGHKVCLMCMVEDVLRSPAPVCPKDNTPITDIQMFDLDYVCKDKISKLPIKCPNKNCPWSGEVIDFETHVLFECKERFAPSTDKCGDEIKEPNEIESSGTKTCSEESEELISCEFEGLGCHVKIKKSQLGIHMKLNMRHHLGLACLKVEQQEQRLQQIKSEQMKELARVETDLERLMTQCQSEKSENHFTWHISFLKSRIVAERRLFSEPFFLRGYKMIIFLALGDFDASNEYLFVGFHVIRGKFDKELKWPFKKKLLFALAEQGLSGLKPLTKISLQPDEAIKMPEGQIDDKMVIKKPMKRLVSFSLIKDSSPKYCVSVEFASERE